MNADFGIYLVILGEIISNIGVVFIAATGFYSAFMCIYELLYKRFNHVYAQRIVLGKGIILGLEFIVAGDVIESAAKPDYYNLGVLVVLIILRIVLSFVLTEEIKHFKSEG